MILFAIFGCIAVGLSMLLPGLFIWACAIAFIVFMVGVALSVEIFYKERRDKAQEPSEGKESSKSEYAEVTEGVYKVSEAETSDYRPELRQIRIDSYKKYFNIDETRASALYDKGYDNLSKISKASVDDLSKIKGINPTLAKKIITQVGGTNL
jgi:hypothetical protein